MLCNRFAALTVLLTFPKHFWWMTRRLWMPRKHTGAADVDVEQISQSGQEQPCLLLPR